MLEIQQTPAKAFGYCAPGACLSCPVVLPADFGRCGSTRAPYCPRRLKNNRAPATQCGNVGENKAKADYYNATPATCAGAFRYNYVTDPSRSSNLHSRRRRTSSKTGIVGEVTCQFWHH